MFAEVREELDLVSWDDDSTCLILQSPHIWMEFAFVLSYSRLPVYFPNCAPVGDGCDMLEDYHSNSGSVMRHVEGIVGE